VLWRIEIVDPSDTKSTTDSFNKLPHRVIPETESELPSFTQFRTETADPRLTKLNTDKLPPSLKYERSESEDPNDAKLSVDTASPILLLLRIEIADPKVT
jgi:hypothetical protein